MFNTDSFPPGYFSMSGGNAPSSVTIPAGSLPKAVGMVLYAALLAKKTVQLAFAVVGAVNKLSLPFSDGHKPIVRTPPP